MVFLILLYTYVCVCACMSTQMYLGWAMVDWIKQPHSNNIGISHDFTHQTWDDMQGISSQALSEEIKSLTSASRGGISGQVTVSNRAGMMGEAFASDSLLFISFHHSLIYYIVLSIYIYVCVFYGVRLLDFWVLV